MLDEIDNIHGSTCSTDFENLFHGFLFFHIDWCAHTRQPTRSTGCCTWTRPTPSLTLSHLTTQRWRRMQFRHSGSMTMEKWVIMIHAWSWAAIPGWTVGHLLLMITCPFTEASDSLLKTKPEQNPMVIGFSNSGIDYISIFAKVTLFVC